MRLSEAIKQISFHIPIEYMQDGISFYFINGREVEFRIFKMQVKHSLSEPITIKKIARTRSKRKL